MRPTHARQRILEDHAELRRRLTNLEAELDFLPDDPTRLPSISETASTLLRELSQHTELEESVLGPVLLEIDAWGQIRERSLREHHAEQRAQLGALAEAYVARQADPDAISRLTRSWICDVRADMSHEERELLTADLLRDDIVAVQMESG